MRNIKLKGLNGFFTNKFKAKSLYRVEEVQFITFIVSDSTCSFKLFFVYGFLWVKSLKKFHFTTFISGVFKNKIPDNFKSLLISNNRLDGSSICSITWEKLLCQKNFVLILICL